MVGLSSGRKSADTPQQSNGSQCVQILLPSPERKIVASQRIEYIDFAKGFAILSIVLFHYCEPYVSGIGSKLVMIGGVGVHLFFLLSGCGLGLSSQKTGAGRFYRRRFARIILPYYLVIMTIYAINVIYPIYEGDGLYALGGHLFFYKMFDEDIVASFGYHFWFISTIVQFYLVYPLVILLKDKVSLPLFAVISLSISVCYWIAITVCHVAEQRVFNSFFLQYLWEFNIGIILADLYLRKQVRFWEHNRILLACLSVAGIGAMALMAMRGGRLGQTFNDVPASIGYFCLSAFVYATGQNAFRVLNRMVIFVGHISYELYLAHMVVFALAYDFLTKAIGVHTNIFISVLCILPLSILIAKLLALGVQAICRGPRCTSLYSEGPLR